MKISKKALALVLALTMIVSTFFSTAVFAAEDQITDSNGYLQDSGEVKAITVTPNYPDGYQLSQGERYQFEMDADGNGNPDGDTYTWSVVKGMSKSYLYSNPDVVSIENGIITAKNPGKVLIMAQKGDAKYYVRVMVTPAQNTKPALTLSGQGGCYEGDSINLNVSAQNADMPKFKVESSNENLATAQIGSENTVIVTAVKGITDHQYVSIKVSADGYSSGILWIAVDPKQVEIKSGNEFTYYSENFTSQVQLAVDATDDTIPPCTWSSSNENVATVDENGNVTVKGPGIVEITAKASDPVYGSDSQYIYIMDENLATLSYSYDGVSYTDEDYLPFDYNTDDGEKINSTNFYYFNDTLMQDYSVKNLYVKVPYKTSDYSFRVLWSGFFDQKSYRNRYNTDPIAVNTKTEGDATVLTIPVTEDVTSYGEIVILAEPLNANEPQMSWSIGYSSDYKEVTPEFGGDGTYTYTNGGKTFSFDKAGSFYWGVAGRPVKNGEVFTDQYGFVYDGQFVKFEIDNNLVSGITANIANENPTLCWINSQSQEGYYVWTFDEGASNPTFIDCFNDNEHPYTLITIDEATKNAAEAIEGLKPDASQSEVAAVINSLKSMTKDQLTPLVGELDTLEALLESVLGLNSLKPSAPKADGIAANDAMTIAPTVSGGLYLAAGLTGSEDTIPPVVLETIQRPAPSNTFLSFDLNLKKDGSKVELKVPLTITFAFPSNFVLDEGIDYSIQHTLSNGSTEILPLTITKNGETYYGTFTTTSFSNFAVVDANNLPSNGGNGGNGDNGGNGGNGGGSGSHHNSYSNSGAATNFVSDTTKDFSVNSAYQFKITSTDGTAPALTAGTPGVFDIQLVKTTGNDYFIKLTAIGKPGAATGIYINGVKLLVATVGTTALVASGVKSDTTGSFNVKAGKAYTFKITANAKPTFTAGTNSAFKIEFVKAVGKDYFYKVTAIGKAGTGSGFFVNSKRVAAATITK